MENKEKRGGDIPTVFSRLPGGGMAELVYSPVRKQTSFSVYRDGLVVEQDAIEIEEGKRLVPISATNNLIKHRAILLPSQVEDYESPSQLAARIAGYLHKYVDLSQSFKKIATGYVLLSWLYDAFNELPYLRLRGDFGSGKTRALSVIGSICYRPFFASGASTVSPIFHTLDRFGCTLILDEGDFRFSDEKSELVKIFNNGNVRGFPVLRTAITAAREFDPRAFDVYGPKIVGMRHSFEDPALESRFLTEEMGQRALRSDIPISLPPAQAEEALWLRNQLLMYRFENLASIALDADLADTSRSPRLNQILLPLLSVIEDESVRDEIWDTAGGIEQHLYRDRAATMDAGILEMLLPMISEEGRSHVTIAEITQAFVAKYGSEYERPITNRTIGGVIRRRLRLAVYKSHGIYVVPASEKDKVMEMSIRHGIAERRGLSQ